MLYPFEENQNNGLCEPSLTSDPSHANGHIVSFMQIMFNMVDCYVKMTG